MDQTHSVESVPALPAGMPETKPGAPKVALTGEQIQYIADLAGRLIPTVKGYAPWIIWVLSIAFGGGYAAGKMGDKTSTDAVQAAPDLSPAIKKLSDVQTAQQKQMDQIVADQKTFATMLADQMKILGAIAPKTKTKAPSSGTSGPYDYSNEGGSP